MLYWYWFIFAIALSVLEILGAQGFMLGAILGAIITGFVSYIWPEITLSYEIVIFCITSTIATLAYWYRFRKFNDATDKPDLNNSFMQQVGKVGITEPNYLKIQGKVKLGDTLWNAKSDQPIEPEKEVKVIDVDKQTLIIESL